MARLFLVLSLCRVRHPPAVGRPSDPNRTSPTEGRRQPYAPPQSCPPFCVLPSPTASQETGQLTSAPTKTGSPPAGRRAARERNCPGSRPVQQQLSGPLSRRRGHSHIPSPHKASALESGPQNSNGTSRTGVALDRFVLLRI